MRWLAVLVFVAWTATSAVGGHAAIAATPAANEASEHAARKGVADLRGTAAADGKQFIPLAGEWEIYWMQLLTPDVWKEERAGSAAGAPQYIEVPSSWNGSDSGGSGEIKYGYATYRLVLRVPPDDVGKQKTILLRSANSASRIWIDGREQSGLGTIGTSLAEERPQSHMNLFFFQPASETVELVVQVSNFSFREGGLNREAVYGDIGAMIPYLLKELLYDMFIIGGFLLVGLYHLIVFAMRRTRREDASVLLVGLLSLAVALRTLFINGYLSTVLLGLDDWEMLVKLEYAMELFGFAIVIFLMRVLYPGETHRRMVQFSVLVSAGLLLFVLLTPVRLFTETMLLQTVAKGVILLYFVGYVGVAAFLRRREGAFIHMIALTAIVAAVANDTLYYLRLADTAELLGYSVIPFLLAQAVIVSYRYSQLSRRNVMLAQQLGHINRTLEEQVEERTRKLQDANETRTKMLVNIAHDLGTPLVGIQTYLQLMASGKLPPNADRGEANRLLLDKTSYMKRLIDDLFELSKLESRELRIDFEETEAGTWLNAVFEKLAADAAGAGFTLQKGRFETAVCGREARIRIDQGRMMRALQNYLDNAVKFSRGFSTSLTLNAFVRAAERSGAEAEFVMELVDYGIGMTMDEQAHVFRRFYKRRERNEQGSGLGLAIVKEIVEQHRGEVGVRSEKGAGSTFALSIPAALDS